MLAPYRQKILNYTEPLTTWQKLYFAAVIIALLELTFGNDKFNFELVGGVALAGLAVELWPKFVQIWETLLGRILVVFSYALVGNFVVTNARHELNTVVGVDPSSLFYATSFVSLITAPLFIIAITLIVMLLYMLFKQLWFIVTFLPWILGLYEKTGMQVAIYPKVTRIVRIVMLPFMFMFLVSMLDFYGDNKNGSDDFIDAVTEGFSQESIATFKKGEKIGTDLKQKTSGQEHTSETEEPAKSSAETDVSTADTSETTSEAETTASKAEKSESTEGDIEDLNASIKDAAEGAAKTSDMTMEKVIATFVYYVEAFEYSQCETLPKERTVSLGEYDILSVIPDKSSSKGYRFSVRPCKLKDYGDTSTSN